MERMRILTVSEQEAFDKPPEFDHRERKKAFDLPKGLLDAAEALRSPGGQIGPIADLFRSFDLVFCLKGETKKTAIKSGVGC